MKNDSTIRPSCSLKRRAITYLAGADNDLAGQVLGYYPFDQAKILGEPIGASLHSC